MMKLIGLGGTNAAGKDSIGEMLAERHGWLFVSVSDLLRDEAKKRGLPVEREVLRTISAEWRREFGLGVLVDKAIEQFKNLNNTYKGLVAVPMRNPGEAQHIMDNGGVLVWVDADPKVRYKRVELRLRSPEDHKTFEEFLAEQHAEMEHHGGDEATLNLSGVKEKADIFLENNGNDVSAFKDQAEQALRAVVSL